MINHQHVRVKFPTRLLAPLSQSLQPHQPIQIIDNYRLPLIPTRHDVTESPLVFNAHLPSHRHPLPKPDPPINLFAPLFTALCDPFVFVSQSRPISSGASITE